MIVWLLILVLVLAFYIYIEFTPKDVDPHFLTHQAAITSTRISGETAVYRSLVNDHGRALLGSAAPINKFTLTHLWKDLDNFRIAHVNQTGTTHEISDLKRLIRDVQQSISTLEEGCRVPISFGASVEGMAVFLAVCFSGRVPVLLKAHTHGVHDEEEEQPIISEVEYEFGSGSTGINVLINGEKKTIPLFWEKAAEQVSDSEITIKSNGVALVSNGTEISETDIGVSIAAQLTAVGVQHRWSKQDTVFMAPASMTVNSIVMMLTALSSGAALLFAETSPTLSAATILSQAKPTIMVSDDVSMRTLCKIADDYRIFEWAQYFVRLLRLAKGKLGPTAMVDGFQYLRLVHTATGPDPFQWLSNGEMSRLRILTGTQLIHMYTPDSGMPITQTSVGDYRSRKLPGVNMGPPLPGLEIKKRGKSLLVHKANHEDYVAVSEDCSANAKLGMDGCLYVPEKRHDFSMYYYYTGELK